MRQVRKRLTYANVMSSIAVFLVLGGGAAFAANELAKNSVGPKQLKKNAVTTAKIKKNAVTTAKIKANAINTAKIKANAVKTAKIQNGAVTGGKLAADSVDASKIPDGSLSTAKLSNLQVTSHKFSATAGANEDAAREAAPAHRLFTKGPLSVYAKCFTDTSGPTTYVAVYGATTQSGSLLSSWWDELDGGPEFLNPDTAEEDREISDNGTSSNNANNEPEGPFHLVAPDGSTLQGWVQLYVKNGTLPEGDGAYGPGNVCIVSGNAFG